MAITQLNTASCRETDISIVVVYFIAAALRLHDHDKPRRVRGRRVRERRVRGKRVRERRVRERRVRGRRVRERRVRVRG